jgi:hypothetical protein
MLEKRGVKKAQITMFVILGLVLLFIFIIIYTVFLRKPSTGDQFKTEAVPEQFKPVQDYVASCIHLVGLDAIKKMGAHGGYIDPLDSELTPVSMRFSETDPTRFELVSLSGASSGAIPYYLYVPGKSSYTNYELGSLAPTVESMNYQLSVYMNRELPKCVGKFSALQELGLEVIPDNYNINTQAFIRDDRIEFFVTYPLNVSKEGGAKATLTKHQNSILFPYKKYYDLAISVMATEMMTQFLESYTNSLIAYHSGMDYNMLPPVIEYSNDPYVLTWSNAKVKNDLNSLLMSYTPALQIVGTKGYEPVTVEGNDVEARFYKSLSMEVFNDTMPNTSITFFYRGNTVVSNVLPSKGDMIKPSIEVEKGNQFIPSSQFNTYKFFYDVAYPVIVEIRGDEPMTEIPQYSFLFALETNLIENKGVLAWNMGMGTVNWDTSYINTTYTFPEGSFYDESGTEIPVEPRSTAKSLFCEESTWLSGNVSVRTIDKTGAPLEGVTVSYGCGDYDECWLGNTGLKNSNADWEGKLPLCRGGYIALTKEGFGAKIIPLTTEEGIGAMLATEKLDKIREIEATVKKFEIQKNIYRDDWEWKEDPETIGVVQDIDSSSEQVIVSITQTGFAAGTNPMSNSIIFGKEGLTESTIHLVPGEYEVTATLIDHNGVIIPSNCSRICKLDVVICFDSEYYPNETVNMTPVPWGGVELKAGAGTAGTFSVTAADLDSGKALEFHVIKLPNLQLANPAGGCLNNLDEMDKIAEYSAKYVDVLKPVWS